jgi:hypothetical protein
MADPCADSHATKDRPVARFNKPLPCPIDKGLVNIVTWNCGSDRVDVSGGRVQTIVPELHGDIARR